MYIMSIAYILAGVNHFLNPVFYLRIIPPVFVNKVLINRVSGAVEILLGVLLVTPLQSYAAWGIIGLLIAVLPANIYHLKLRGAGMRVPMWVLWLRIPLQGVLIWWAYLYT